MGLSILCGLALGWALNLAADWLPLHVQPKQDDALPPPEQGALRATGQRWLRWAALLLLSVGLVWRLRSTDLSLLPGVMPELAYCSLLLLIATIDLEHRLVPNVLILTGLILALGFNVLSTRLAPPLGGAESRAIWSGGLPGLTASLAGAAVGGGLFLLLALARRHAMGAGDVKLAFLIGMLTGFPGVLQALVVGILLGGLAAALLLLFRLRGPRQYIPYAPYLVAGAMAALLYGQRIAHWYARLLGLEG